MIDPVEIGDFAIIDLAEVNCITAPENEKVLVVNYTSATSTNFNFSSVDDRDAFFSSLKSYIFASERDSLLH